MAYDSNRLNHPKDPDSLFSLHWFWGGFRIPRKSFFTWTRGTNVYVGKPLRLERCRPATPRSRLVKTFYRQGPTMLQTQRARKQHPHQWGPKSAHDAADANRAELPTSEYEDPWHCGRDALGPRPWAGRTRDAAAVTRGDPLNSHAPRKLAKTHTSALSWLPLNA